MKKKLLIIKPDHIGDYIIFFNYLETLKNSKKFKNYEIHLLGNLRIKDMAEYLNTITYSIDKFIWIDLAKYTQNGYYTQFRNKEIIKTQYDVILNLKFFVYKPIEQLIQNIKVNEKIVIKNISHIYTQHIESFYTKIIDISTKKLFKFERFKIAFQELLNEDIHLEKPIIQLPKKDYCNQFSNYIIIYIGADNDTKKWNIHNYIQLISFILHHYDINILLCGGPAEIQDAQIITSHFNSSNFTNLVGETTTADLLKITANSKLVITNETGEAHISMALDIPTLVISNGTGFGKFTPYPTSYTNKYYVIYPFTVNTKEDYEKYSNLYYILASDLDINLITLTQVITKVKMIFNTLSIKYMKKQDELLVTNSYLLSQNQQNSNYKFSFMFSKLISSIHKLAKTDEKYVIYGDTSLSKVIIDILKDQVLCIIDQKSDIISHNNIDHTQIYSIKNLEYINYDKIIISVLGRENDILENLLNNYNLDISKIILFKIINKEYIGN